MIGWLCRNDQSSNSQSSSTSGSQTPKKNVMLQAKDHFRFVFNEFKKILNSRKNPIFDENWSMIESVIYGYYCCQIGNQQMNEKIKKRVLNNESIHREKFLSYFTQRVSRPSLIEDELNDEDHFFNFLCDYGHLDHYVAYFYFASFLDLDHRENKEINQCLELILDEKKIEESNLLVLRLSLLDATRLDEKKNGIHEKVKNHFHDNFDDYFKILTSNSGVGFTKLKLANVLKKVKPADWGNKNWEKEVSKKYKKPFQTQPFLNSSNLVGQNLFNAQREWINDELEPKIWELWLWQELGYKKISKFFFEEIFSKDHLKILENCIRDKNNPQKLANIVALCFHESLRPAVQDWIANLKKIQNDEKKIWIVLRELSDFKECFYNDLE